MPTVSIDDKGCRGCTLCVDICPVEVFELEPKTEIAKVKCTENCVGCLSCQYLCPSECVSITDVQLIRPFHRTDANGAFIEKFIQAKLPSRALSREDLDKGKVEIALLLRAYGEAVEEVIGRGHKALGRRAGNLAASHLPEMYEDKDLDRVLARMRTRFGRSFAFQHRLSGDQVELSVEDCGLAHVVQSAGGKVGEHNLCQIFHEYWAGLVSSFTGNKYGYEVPQAGASCRIVLKPQ
jgi:ferredoxin